MPNRFRVYFLPVDTMSVHSDCCDDHFGGHPLTEALPFCLAHVTLQLHPSCPPLNEYSMDSKLSLNINYLPISVLDTIKNSLMSLQFSKFILGKIST